MRVFGMFEAAAARWQHNNDATHTISHSIHDARDTCDTKMWWKQSGVPLLPPVTIYELLYNTFGANKNNEANGRKREREKNMWKLILKQIEEGAKKTTSI